MNSLTLAIDTGSPVVSVALGAGPTPLAHRSATQREASGSLLRLVDEVLVDAGHRVSEVARIVALSGPGSFTGLRVGMATVLGLHQALGMPATALPTLEVLASWAQQGAGIQTAAVVAVVDALRGEWFAQRFELDEWPSAIEAPQRIAASMVVAELATSPVVGFGARRLAAFGADPSSLLEPDFLAVAALAVADRSGLVWDPGTLLEPLYLRSPVIDKTPRPGLRGAPGRW